LSAIELAGPSGVGKSTLAANFARSGTVGLDDALLGIQAAQTADSALRPFVGLLEEVFKTARGDRQEQRRSFLYRSLWRLILAKRAKTPIVLDGGLLRRAHGVVLLRSDVDICDYFRLMPLADAIVFLRASREVIEARNRAREQDRSSEIGMAIEVDRIAVEILTERGANLHFIDATRPPEENTGHLCTILESC
jgi:broad-specificity NMP kinase